MNRPGGDFTASGSSWRCRDSFDLQQKIGAVEPGHFHKCHSRCCGWRDRIEKPISRLSVSSEIIHVSQEHRYLHEIACRASGLGESSIQVPKDLVRLSGEIAFANNSAVAVQICLTGDENQSARAHFHHLRVAWGRPERGWIQISNGLRHAGRLCPRQASAKHINQVRFAASEAVSIDRDENRVADLALDRL